MSEATIESAAGVGDAAVRGRTGRGWAEWFALLDAVGARQMSHREVASYLGVRHALDPWWQQTVTVGYEQARGLRKRHQRTNGFRIRRTRTVAAPVSALYAAWSNPRQRGLWLAEPGLAVRGQTPPHRIRATWSDGHSQLDISLRPRGVDRCQVTVEHTRLLDAGEAERMKAFWTGSLERLRDFVAGRPPVGEVRTRAR